jgi:PKHD-type hydroxylase
MWYLNTCATPSHVCVDDAFTDEELDKIIATGLSFPHRKARILGQTEDLKIIGSENSDIRNVNEYDLEITNDTRWIYERISGVIKEINAKIFNFDLTWFEPLQVLRYEGTEGGCYKIHSDAPYDVNNIIAMRKLSLILQLSADDEYCGGDINLHLNAMDQDNSRHTSLSHIMPRKRGTMILFPSTLLHEVTSLTSGKRISLVTWVHGPKFR